MLRKRKGGQIPMDVQADKKDRFKEYNAPLETDQSNDHIYYNIVIPHDDTQGYALTPAQFRVQVTTPIIEDPSDYWLTVARFSVPGFAVPLLIFKVVDGQANPNLGIYTVTLFNQSTSATSQQNVIFTPRSNSSPAGAPIPSQQVIPYYFVYEYQHMIDMINTALNAAWVVVGSPGTAAPYLIYDPISQLISLITTATFDYKDGTGTQIFFNSPLFNLVEGMPSYYYGANAPLGKEYQLLSTDYKNNAYFPPDLGSNGATGPATFWALTQEFFALGNWNSFKSILFATNMSVNKEYIPTKSTPSLSFNSLNQSDTNSIGILTDFEPDVSTSAGDSRGIFQYAAILYRLIDMNSNTPLRFFDITVYWSDVYGNVYPLELATGQTVTIKLLFIKRNSFP
jgi:hypothetical protein